MNPMHFWCANKLVRMHQLFCDEDDDNNKNETRIYLCKQGLMNWLKSRKISNSELDEREVEKIAQQTENNSNNGFSICHCLICRSFALVSIAHTTIMYIL